MTCSLELNLDITILEKIQRRATKIVPKLKSLSYENRLRRLNLTTLEYRRHCTDVHQVYRFLNGINNIDSSHFFYFSTNITKGDSLKLLEPRANTSIRQNSFSHRVINLWNDLQDEVVSSDSLNIFKNKLEKAWANKTFKYCSD